MMFKTHFCLLSLDKTRVLVLFLMFTIINSASQPETGSCSLDFPVSNHSRCEGGDWGGFLQKNCCGSTFYDYLQALGMRANRTGLLFLDSIEQSSCFSLMDGQRANFLDCGVEKLKKGLGGCSNFSVTDVTEILGQRKKTLSESCSLERYEGVEGEWDEHCGHCVRSWRAIREAHATPGRNNVSDLEPLRVEADICRFAVLISVMSYRIGDARFLQGVYKCLGEQNHTSGNDSYSDTKFTVTGEKKNVSTGLWILIGAVIGLVIIAITVTIASRRWHRAHGTASKKGPRQKSFKDLDIKGSSCPKLTIKEVYAATENLHCTNLIGEGTEGKVYRGILSENKQVAIKHIVSVRNVENVVKEVLRFSHVRHPNLVSLLGYCLRQDECFLIYELCQNGNLSEWIFAKNRTLSWIQRLEIAIDTAKALRFLHTYSEGCIVHRDVKPKNILLGPKCEAKLSDFGLSKVINLGETHVSSEVRGTFGYVDPEYQNNHQVNSSGDVYSFGIVLLQILSGKKVINMNRSEPMPLEKMAKSITRGGSIGEFADRKLGGDYSEEAFGLTFQLALSCTSLKQQRPTMVEVVEKLEHALDISINAIASTPTTATTRGSVSNP